MHSATSCSDELVSRLAFSALAVLLLLGSAACASTSTSSPSDPKERSTEPAASSGDDGTSDDATASASAHDKTNSDAGSSTSDDDPPPKATTDACKLDPGTYVLTFTTEPGGHGLNGAACTPLSSTTIEIDETGSPSGTVASGCTRTTDTATCTMTTTCTSSTATIMTKAVSTTKIEDGKLVGHTTTKTTQKSDGTVLYDCSYDSVGVPL